MIRQALETAWGVRQRAPAGRLRGLSGAEPTARRLMADAGR